MWICFTIATKQYITKTDIRQYSAWLFYIAVIAPACACGPVLCQYDERTGIFYAYRVTGTATDADG